MGNVLGSAAELPFGDYSTDASWAPLVGQTTIFDDIDPTTGAISKNSQYQRECVLVKNNSGSAIAASASLNFNTGTSDWGANVQTCPAGATIRLFAPPTVKGSASTTIPNNAYFWAIKKGATSVNSDGSAILLNDGLVQSATAGQVKTDYGVAGGEVFASAVASTVLTNTVTATKYDQNYTFPANSLNAGDHIRITGEISIPSGNSTDTLTTDLMLGSQVINTLAAFDPTNGGGDIIAFVADIEIRTAGASGTMVATVTWTKNVNGTTTVAEAQLASTAIDTTATQQVALRGTWSVANAADQSRLDMLNIAKLSTQKSHSRFGAAMAAAAGGSSVAFRAYVNCDWK